MHYAIIRLETNAEFATIPQAVAVPFDTGLVEHLNGLCNLVRNVPDICALSIFRNDLVFIKTLPADIEERLDESDGQMVVGQESWIYSVTQEAVDIGVIKLFPTSDDFVIEGYHLASYAEIYTAAVEISWLTENL